ALTGDSASTGRSAKPASLLLGNPCSMHDLVDLCTRKNLFLFEDCCEAHGAEFQGQKVGTFGDMSSSSFYFSHHMTTGEGGMLSIRDESRFADIARSLRAHGWVRERSDRQVFLDANPELDPRWLFVSQGYNVRSMDLNAAIGLVQLRRLSAWVEDRVRIRAAMAAALEPYADRLRFQRVTEDGLHSGFGFSMILRPEAGLDRKRFMASLESRGIECRPLVGGNMARQPVARHLDARIAGTLSGADLAHDHGLMIGIHASVTDAQIEHLASAVGRALQENG
nr:DegT/DnrJ/EryC1/StrS family aminotransferase [Planctomycetota bacterium]